MEIYFPLLLIVAFSPDHLFNPLWLCVVGPRKLLDLFRLIFHKCLDVVIKGFLLNVVSLSCNIP